MGHGQKPQASWRCHDHESVGCRPAPRGRPGHDPRGCRDVPQSSPPQGAQRWPVGVANLILLLPFLRWNIDARLARLYLASIAAICGGLLLLDLEDGPSNPK
jgi:hypothetical protein